MSNKKLWIKNELILAMVIPAIFFFIGFGMKLYFQNNAFPVDYETTDSYDWADMFLSLYMFASIFCAIYNIIIAVIGTKFEIHSQKAWFIYGIIALVLSSIAPIYMCFNYREESICTIIMVLLFVIEYVVTFIISTLKCPRHWDFFPFK